MAVYTVTLNNVTGPDVVTLTDGSTYATLEVSAGRGPKGDGWTGGSYSESTGVVTFTSNDGLGFATGDLRPDLSEPDPIGDVTPNTGAFTSLSTTGDTVIGGDLTVNGTTTTVNTQTLDVADKNITVAYGAADPASANGGGLTVDGADATLTYQSAGDNWALNKDLSVSGDITLTGTVDGRDVAADGSVIDGLGTISTQDNDSVDINGGAIDGTVIGGSTPAAGSFTTGSFTGDVSFGDNDKAIFGAGSDLQIYHDGFNNYIDGVSGAVFVRGSRIDLRGANNELMLVGNQNGSLISYYDNAAKLATTSTGIDVTGQLVADSGQFDGNVNIDGTVTADGLTVDGATQIDQLQLDDGYIRFQNATSQTPAGAAIYRPSGTADLNIMIGSKNAVKFANGGDISFYEDTGTTPKFFWDASAESLGIGTSSPTADLHVYTDAGGSQEMLFLQNVAAGDNHYLKINVNNTANEVNYISSGTSGGSHVFYRTASTEAMRIDASGNLLVGTTDVAPYVSSTETGVALRSAFGLVGASRDSGASAIFNRLNSDGNIAEFRRDGSTVGSIGSETGYAYYTGGSSGLMMRDSDIVPTNGSGAKSDNSKDLGDPSYRFDDIYATNGTIQTSDRNEKQDIEALSDAEQRVAVACKVLLRKFRWKDAVAEKGDDARIHFGIIAQDLQDAFSAEGLDAGRYAMFISSTWTDEETGEERTRMGVRYSELLAFIIAAI